MLSISYFFGFLAVLCALYVAFSKDLIRISVAFFIQMCAVGGVLLDLGSEYLAIVVLAVGVLGAVLILAFSSIMMGNLKLALKNEFQNRKGKKNKFLSQILGMLIGFSLSFGLGFVLIRAQFLVERVQEQISKKSENFSDAAHLTSWIGAKLLGEQLAVFEMIAIMVLVATVGSVMLLRKQKNAE